MIDSGSHKSLINAELRDKLLLQTIRTERIVLKLFESTKEVARNVGVVKVHISKNNKGIDVELYVIPYIRSPISNQNIQACAQYEHLANLCLAESTYNSETLSVDILIGGDLY